MFSKLLGKPRTIKTARNVEEINTGAKKGYIPLVKRVIPSEKIRSKYAVYQSKKTNEIIVSGDYRSEYSFDDDYEEIIGFNWYYPHTFESPFAAYLIPKDIKEGEKVFLEDLIEDYIGRSWNQGDKYRLQSCMAIWNGTDFDILYEEPKEPTIIG